MKETELANTADIVCYGKPHLLKREEYAPLSSTEVAQIHPHDTVIIKVS